jgi:hypothetical protein
MVAHGLAQQALGLLGHSWLLFYFYHSVNFKFFIKHASFMFGTTRSEHNLSLPAKPPCLGITSFVVQNVKHRFQYVGTKLYRVDCKNGFSKPANMPRPEDGVV